KAYPNTATADGSNTSPVTASATTTVLCPNLSITKTADAASVSAGDPIGFTITVTNGVTPGGTAKAVALSDPLPSGVAWSIASGPAGCAIAAGTLTCPAVDLAPGASYSVHVTAPTTEASCKAYPNTATADGSNTSPVTASATTTVLCPNLQITKTADAAAVSAGDPVGFTITVSNLASPG